MNFKVNVFIAAMAIRDTFPFKIYNPLREGLVEALNDLKVNGFAILPFRLKDSDCSDIKEWIDNNLKDFKRYNSDYRMNSSEKYNSQISSLFSNNRDIKEIGQKYLRSKIYLQTTMAAKLTFKPQNLGSGQGWHRDSYSSQYKSMCYLTDVGKDNGPFEYVLKSHTYRNIINELKMSNKPINKYTFSRFSPDFVTSFTEKFNLKKEKVYGNKGEIIIFDSRGMHRGHPIKNGSRYAITNYFIKSSQNRKGLLEE